MIDHISLHVTDFEKSKKFYSETLAPLGYTMTGEFPEWQVAGFGIEGKADLWIQADGAGKSQHIAYVASSAAAVQQCYDAGLAAGGTDNGAPGFRKEYSPGYFAAYVHDPDGNNIEFVFHDPAGTPAE